MSRAKKKTSKGGKPKVLTERESDEALATIMRVINAWEKHAPNTKFGGVSVDEFRKLTQPSFDTRAEIALLEWKIEQLQKTLADEHSTVSEPERRKARN